MLENFDFVVTKELGHPNELRHPEKLRDYDKLRHPKADFVRNENLRTDPKADPKPSIMDSFCEGSDASRTFPAAFVTPPQQQLRWTVPFSQPNVQCPNASPHLPSQQLSRQRGRHAEREEVLRRGTDRMLDSPTSDRPLLGWWTVSTRRVEERVGAGEWTE